MRLLLLLAVQVTSTWELVRVVPAENGIYYPLCHRRDVGGTCGYP
jgi:hypothetical protein